MKQVDAWVIAICLIFIIFLIILDGHLADENINSAFNKGYKQGKQDAYLEYYKQREDLVTCPQIIDFGDTIIYDTIYLK